MEEEKTLRFWSGSSYSTVSMHDAVAELQSNRALQEQKRKDKLNQANKNAERYYFNNQPQKKTEGAGTLDNALRTLSIAAESRRIEKL